MSPEKMIQYAVEEGYAAAEIVNTAEIVFDPSFRQYCAENICGQYGANHSCPPSCGSPEFMKQKILAHRKALVLQSLWQISDYGDMAAIQPAKSAHNAWDLNLVKRLRAEGCQGFLVGASGCALCSPCAQLLGQPCRFPQEQYSCMSSYCIFVKKLTDLCDIEYDYGEGLLSFFSMYVFD